MERRDVLKALATIVGVSGATFTAVTAHDVQGVELVMLKVKRHLSHEQIQQLRGAWQEAVKGTSLKDAHTVVVDHSIDVEFVRTKP